MPWVEQWEVVGSKGTIYKVSRADDGTWGCSCPNWIHRHTDCKHIREVQNGRWGKANPVQDPLIEKQTNSTIQEALTNESIIEWF